MVNFAIMCNIRKMIFAESENVKIINAVEILRKDQGVNPVTLFDIYAKRNFVDLTDGFTRFRLNIEEERILLYKNGAFAKEYEYIPIYTRDDANRREWFDTPSREKDKTYVELEVFDVINRRAFVPKMPWIEGVIYVYDGSLGEFGGWIHFPACDSVAEIMPLFNRVIDVLDISGASYQFGEIHIHRNNDVTKYKMVDFLGQ